MFDNVVVGIDAYQGGRHSLELARALASPDGRITLVYVEALQSTPAPKADTRSDDERQRFGLERLSRLRDEAQIAAEVARVQAPSVRHGLHEYAADCAADLLVIGASTRNDVARSLLGDDVREVLDDPPCTVAVAPAWYSEGSGPISKIGVAYDGSPESERALEMAETIAAERGATLSAFQAVPAPVYARDPWDVEDEIDEDVKAARDRIAALGIEPHAGFTEDTVEGLRRFGEDVDLLVLGSHTYHPPDRLFHRSKSQRLADGPPAPLLLLSSARSSADRADDGAAEGP